MKKYSSHTIAIFALGILALFSISLSAQTLSLNDGSVLRSNPHRAGVNIGAIDYWDNGQILKNLIGTSDPGFEPLLDQQIWVLYTAGTTTSYSIQDIFDGVPANYWAGGTFTVVETQSGGAELGCTGTIASNTGPNYPLVGQSTYTSPVVTVSSPCNAAFSVGDIIIMSKSVFPTPETWWESGGRGGTAGTVSGGAQLLSDTTDLCATCGTQALNLNATASGSQASASWYYDGESQDDIFVLMNGTYQLSFWAKLASGTPVLTASASRGSSGGFNCGTYTPKLTSEWAQYTWTCTAAETPATTPSAASVGIAVKGGSVYLDNVSFEKVPGSFTNPTVLRDEVVQTLQNYYGPSIGSNPGTFRYWVNQNGESISNWTQPDYAHAPTTSGTGYFVGPGGMGTENLSLEDYLVICQFLNAQPYLEVPVTLTTADAANLIEFLASPSTTSYGARRAALGQEQPWTSVFSQIHLSFCNECWNGASFDGQSLAMRNSAPNLEYYYDYSVRARDIFAAMRSDNYYSQSAFDLVMNAQTAVNYTMDTAIARAHPDSIEIEDYTYGNVNDFSSDAAMWQPAMVDPWEKVTYPKDIANFYQSVHDYQSQTTCGATGTATCNVNIYEWGQGTLGGLDIAGVTPGANLIDQAHLDYVNAGGGEGAVMALQPLLNIQYYGIDAQSFFALTEYKNGGVNGLTAKLWGNTVDMGGGTNNVRPTFLGVQLVNQSIIGPMYSCPIANNLTYNFPGSMNGIGVNQPSSTNPTPIEMPAMTNVPYLYGFCFENGTKRSLVLINTDVTSSHTISFGGTNPPFGAVTQRQLAPASPDDLNEAHIGTATTQTPATVSIETSTLNSPTSINLPPYSVTALDYTAAGLAAAAMPVFSPAGGTYTTPQSVSITDTTPGSTIYYSTDGTTPTTSSSVYGDDPIAVSAGETLEAIAVQTGYSNSPAAIASYTIAPLLPEPTFSVAPSTYSTTQSVTINDSMAGTTIYYTTNGTTPTVSSTPYTGAISVSATETIEAIAVKTGYTNSPAAAAAYIIAPALPLPVFSPAPGTYTGPLAVTITEATGGAMIYYTTDGSIPTTSSTPYTGAIWQCETQTLKAIAVETNYTTSAVAIAAYTIAPVLPSPTFSLAGGPAAYPTPQTVTISDSSAGATIYYTTNGTTPTAASTKYTGAITVSTTETIEAIAIETNCTDSAVSSVLYTIANSTLPAPSFSPAAGTYSGSQSVTISDSIAGTNIYYTTNGTTPTTSSTKYNGAITVSAIETLEAIAVETGQTNSPVATAAYVINTGIPAPTFSVAAGTYTSSQTVSISDATAGTSIYYTTNGTTPSPSSTKYSSAITVSATETLEAIAVETGQTNSPVATAAYVINPGLPAPTFSVAAGTYTSSQTVSISDATAGTTIYYTTNGSAPTTSSSVYGGAITVSSTETLEAIAAEAGYTNSAVTSALYTISSSTLPAPSFSPAAGLYTSPQGVKITDASAGATIYYTTNGTTPTTSSTVYTGTIWQSSTQTLEAIAVQTGYANSAVTTAAYTIAPVLPTPTFSLAGGQTPYATAQSVTISDQAGATIYYTTNGTTPTASSTKYSGAITVSATETIEAIAIETGYTNSAVASVLYTIAPPTVAAPTFSPAPGFYTSPQGVQIADTTGGATIYYTTDGTTPTTSSIQYRGAIWQSQSQTLRAIAVETGYATSPVTTAAYTIAPVLPTPTFSLAGGQTPYTTPQIVTISDQAGATIYYTTNGTTPTTASAVYSGAITVSSTETIEAIAVETGFTNSAVGSVLYTIATSTLPAPMFSPGAGTYTTSQSVSIADATAGATIYYTTNGAMPTTSSSVYSGAISVSATETVEAIAVETGYITSPPSTGAYTITGSGSSNVVEDFTISSSGTSAVVSPGGSVSYALTVTPLSPAITFPTAINLSANGLPQGATYSFSPAAVAEGAGATAVALTVQLPRAASAQQPAGGIGSQFSPKIAPLALGLLLLPFAGRLRRSGKRMGRAMPVVLLLVAVAFAVIGLGGCGSTNALIRPAQQSYAVTVIGTSGSLSKSTIVTLIVTQ